MNFDAQVRGRTKLPSRGSLVTLKKCQVVLFLSPDLFLQSCELFVPHNQQLPCIPFLLIPTHSPRLHLDYKHQCLDTPNITTLMMMWGSRCQADIIISNITDTVTGNSFSFMVLYVHRNHDNRDGNNQPGVSVLLYIYLYNIYIIYYLVRDVLVLCF